MVEVDQRPIVPPPTRGELGQQLGRSCQIGLGRTFRGETGRLRLEHGPDLAEPRQVTDVDGRDHHSAPRVDLDQLLLREPTQRLAHGRAADPEPLDELRLLHQRSGRELQRHDQLAKLEVRLVGERRGPAEPGAQARSQP